MGGLFARAAPSAPTGGSGDVHAAAAVRPLPASCECTYTNRHTYIYNISYRHITHIYDVCYICTYPNYIIHIYTSTTATSMCLSVGPFDRYACALIFACCSRLKV